MSPTPTDPQLLRKRLDALSDGARRYLSRWSLRRDIRSTCRDALVWLLAAPATVLVVQVALVLAGRAPLTWSWPLLAVLAAVGPVLFVVGSVAWRATRHHVDRRACLGVYDQQMQSRDRLVIADEFLSADLRQDNAEDNFRLAAIDDAATHIDRAMQTSLDPRVLPVWSVSRRSWIAVPAAVMAILAAVWLGGIAGPDEGNAPADATLAAADLQTLPARIEARLPDLGSVPPRADRLPADERAEADDARSSSEGSPRSTKSEQDAPGQSQAGGQANSRSSSQAMSSSGTPSNQQTPSEAVEDDPPQEQQSQTAAQARKPNDKQPEQQATTATSGQGQSKSSSSDLNSIPATDRPDRAGANKDDGEDEEGIQDEEEEEKTAGVERPSLRRNKPPVDRNLSTRPTGDQPSPDANGRSGPGGRKKTRGVPAMILGIPTPDRIQGMTNPGRSKVTQENSTPKEESQADLLAEQRRARETPFGHIEHPLLQPWMRDLIQKYFLQLREKKPPS